MKNLLLIFKSLFKQSFKLVWLFNTLYLFKFLGHSYKINCVVDDINNYKHEFSKYPKLYL